ncbi:MAG: hypothetical protein RJA69_637 [Pseudomonadota bacterium]|jgi:hypothetical protein
MKADTHWLTRWRTPPPEEVMGHRIAEPRLTGMAWVWGMLILGGPIVLLGMAVDGVIQAITGECTGVWCWF